MAPWPLTGAAQLGGLDADAGLVLMLARMLHLARSRPVSWQLACLHCALGLGWGSEATTMAQRWHSDGALAGWLRAVPRSAEERCATVAWKVGRTQEEPDERKRTIWKLFGVRPLAHARLGWPWKLSCPVAPITPTAPGQAEGEDWLPQRAGLPALLLRAVPEWQAGAKTERARRL
jgi:hypothetical protein